MGVPWENPGQKSFSLRTHHKAFQRSNKNKPISPRIYFWTNTTIHFFQHMYFGSRYTNLRYLLCFYSKSTGILMHSICLWILIITLNRFPDNLFVLAAASRWIFHESTICWKCNHLQRKVLCSISFFIYWHLVFTYWLENVMWCNSKAFLFPLLSNRNLKVCSCSLQHTSFQTLLTSFWWEDIRLLKKIKNRQSRHHVHIKTNSLRLQFYCLYNIFNYRQKGSVSGVSNPRDSHVQSNQQPCAC